MTESCEKADAIEVMTSAMLDMAKAYGLGTPESRAIITAVEHARINVGVTQPQTG
jgi:hypothetical protein